MSRRRALNASVNLTMVELIACVKTWVSVRCKTHVIIDAHLHQANGQIAVDLCFQLDLNVEINIEAQTQLLRTWSKVLAIIVSQKHGMH